MMANETMTPKEYVQILDDVYHKGKQESGINDLAKKIISTAFANRQALEAGMQKPLRFRIFKGSNPSLPYYALLLNKYNKATTLTLCHGEDFNSCKRNNIGFIEDSLGMTAEFVEESDE